MAPVLSRQSATIFLTAREAVADAAVLWPLGNGLGFQVEPGRLAYLVTGNNPASFAQPHPTQPLSLVAGTARFELLSAQGEFDEDCAVLPLLCDGEGRVVERPRLLLQRPGSRTQLLATAEAKGLAFSVRLSGEGRIELLRLRMTLADGQPQEIELRPEPQVDLTAWLDRVPMPRRLPLVRQMLSAQSLLLAQVPAPGAPSPADTAALAAENFRGNGWQAALLTVLEQQPGRKEQAAALEALTPELASDPEALLDCCWMALACSPGRGRALRLSRIMFHAGSITEAAAMLDAAGPGGGSEIRTSAELLAQPPALLRGRRPPEWSGARVAYVAHTSLPWVASGYTVRTMALLRALREAGLDARCQLRPSFPWDIDESIEPGEMSIEDVPHYLTRLEAGPRIESAARTLEQQWRGWRPGLVHAASNHRNALPALMAARRLGLPFVYEMRGLWHWTEAARRPHWSDTERFALDQAMELHVAKSADCVLAITEVLADWLREQGVQPDRIEVLPNAAGPHFLNPSRPDAGLRAKLRLEGRSPILVYAGSVTLYEGLDDLLRAVALMRNAGWNPGLVIVGGGPAVESLRGLTAELDLESNVGFVGEVPPAEAVRYLALADMVALPRKALAVCELVSPLKPFEAMAMARPVILSDLPALREIVVHDHTGLIVPPNDPPALAAAIERLASDAGLRERIGSAARQWVEDCRTWSVNAARLKKHYERVACLPLEMGS